VVVREEQLGRKQLVAYLVTSDKSQVTSSADPSFVTELRGFLSEKLPDYMLPAAFVVLDSLPLTPNGKLDRRALPAPEQTRPTPDDAFGAPRTPTERILAQIWAELLRRE